MNRGRVRVREKEKAQWSSHDAVIITHLLFGPGHRKLVSCSYGGASMRKSMGSLDLLLEGQPKTPNRALNVNALSTNFQIRADM